MQAHTWGSCLDAPVPCWPLSWEPWPSATWPLPHVSVFMARHLASSKTNDQREGENKSTKTTDTFMALSLKSHNHFILFIRSESESRPHSEERN